MSYISCVCEDCGTKFVYEGLPKGKPKLCPTCKSYESFSVDGGNKAKNAQPNWGRQDKWNPPDGGFDLPGGKREGKSSA